MVVAAAVAVASECVLGQQNSTGAVRGQTQEEGGAQEGGMGVGGPARTLEVFVEGRAEAGVDRRICAVVKPVAELARGIVEASGGNSALDEGASSRTRLVVAFAHRPRGRRMLQVEARGQRQRASTLASRG